MDKILLLPLPKATGILHRRNAGHFEKKFEGRVTPGMLKDFLKDVYAGSAACSGEGTLLNFSGATLDLHFNDMLALTDWESQQTRRPFARLAIVVDNMVSYGLGRMYATLASDLHDTQVFRDKAEAVAWLKEGA